MKFTSENLIIGTVIIKNTSFSIGTTPDISIGNTFIISFITDNVSDAVYGLTSLEDGKILTVGRKNDLCNYLNCGTGYSKVSDGELSLMATSTKYGITRKYWKDSGCTK